MVVAEKRFDLLKIKISTNNLCLKVVTHPSTNPARPGLTLELVCLPSLSFAKIPFFSITSNFTSVEYIVLSPTNTILEIRYSQMSPRPGVGG